MKTSLKDCIFPFPFFIIDKSRTDLEQVPKVTKLKNENTAF
jgi:hypothetical protein